MKYAWIILLMATSSLADVTPDQWLAAQPKPVFGINQTFPKLNRWANWTVTTPTVYSNTVIELANNWGYAVTLGFYAESNTAIQCVTPGTTSYGLCLMVSNNPTKYKLEVIMNRIFTNPPTGFYCTNAAGQFVDNSGHSWTDSSYTPLVSPESPNDYWTNISSYTLNSLNIIQSNCPVSYIINGGEYGLGSGWLIINAANQDPRVAIATNAYPNGGAGLGPYLNQYISDSASRQLGILSTLVKQTFTNRILFYYFTTGNEEERTTNRLPNAAITNWSEYANQNFFSSNMVPIFDISSPLMYYEPSAGTHHAFTNQPLAGLYGPQVNLIAEYLNQVAFDYTYGVTNTYCWVSGGYSATDINLLSDINRYTGFLKCLYVGGMIGACGGYFSTPVGGYGTRLGGPNFDAAFPIDSPPDWLVQYAQLAHVHAFFTQHENMLTTNSTLLSDHISSLSPDFPALEFTNTVADTNVHVLVRLMNSGGKWLVCAWAAAGTNRNVTVNIPTAGAITVLARDSGAVYTITGGTATMMDSDGMNPDFASTGIFTTGGSTGKFTTGTGGSISIP